MRNQFTFYSSYYEAVKQLPKKEQVNVILAICGYALMDEEPELTGTSKAIFDLMRPMVQESLELEDKESVRKRLNREYNQRYRERKRDEFLASQKSHADLTQTSRTSHDDLTREIPPPSSPLKPPINPPKERISKDIPKKSPPASVFVPPSVEDVRAYCLERCNGINPEQFVDFYSSKGWMIGKNKMKDWRAAVRTWERSRSADTAIDHADPPQIDKPPSRFVPTGEFEGYWEDFVDGEWVRLD